MNNTPVKGTNSVKAGGAKLDGARVRKLVAGGLKALLSAALLIYMIWPLDFIPDLVIGVGWLDDLAALVMMIFSVIGSIKDFRNGSIARWEKRADSVFGKMPDDQ